MRFLHQVGAVFLALIAFAAILAPTDTDSLLPVTLAYLLPGFLWWLVLAQHESPAWEDVLTGLGVAYVVGGLISLLITYWPGPVPRAPFLVTQGLFLVVVPTTIIILRGVDIAYTKKTLHWTSLIILGLAAALRLSMLAYNEVEGDEALVLLRAAQAINGRDDVLLWHKKGPIEIALSILTWHVGRTIDEVAIRLPFTLAGLLGLAGVLALASRITQDRIGWSAAALLTINGYLVAFSRIVQYQSIVVAFVVLSLLTLERGYRWHRLLAGVFLGYAFLAHYDAILAVPVFFYYLWLKCGCVRSYWRAAALASAGFLSTALLFYAPFLFSPGFSYAWSYLTRARVGGDSWLHNNLHAFVQLDTFYNSVYYLLPLAALLLVAGMREWRKWPRGMYALVGLLLVVTLLTWMRPDLFDIDGFDLSIIPHISLLLLAILAPRTPETRRAAWVWFATCYLFYLFIVKDPRTHVYTIFPPAALLAGDVISRAWDISRRSPVGRYAFALVTLGLYGLAVGYIYVAFIQPDPEYRHTYPASHLSLYWRPSQEIPPHGYFGFQHRAGWKVIGPLYATGQLHGVYGSNEIPRITHWYTQNAPRTECPYPDYFLIAENVLDPLPVPENLEEQYTLVGIVSVKDEPRLRIYQRGKRDVIPSVYRAEDFEEIFDAGAVPQAWGTGMHLPSDLVPTDVHVGESIRLIGYTLSTREVQPGSSFQLTLFWKTDRRLEENYVVFVHLIERDGGPVGIGDSLPNCAAQPTPLWLPGEVILDMHDVTVDQDGRPGVSDLFIGMYDLFTGTRIPIYLSGQRMPGDTLYLTSLEVLPSETDARSPK